MTSGVSTFLISQLDVPIQMLNPVPIGTGMHLAAVGRQENDFLLLKQLRLSSRLQCFFQWLELAAEPAQNGVILHHPSGDIKKVALYNQASIYNGELIWNSTVTPANHHFSGAFSGH